MIVTKNNAEVQLSKRPVYTYSFISSPGFVMPPPKNIPRTTILISDTISNVQLDIFLILVTAIVVSYFLNLRLYLITKSSKVIEASSIWFRIASSLLNK